MPISRQVTHESHTPGSHLPSVSFPSRASNRPVAILEVIHVFGIMSIYTTPSIKHDLKAPRAYNTCQSRHQSSARSIFKICCRIHRHTSSHTRYSTDPTINPSPELSISAEHVHGSGRGLSRAVTHLHPMQITLARTKASRIGGWNHF